MAHKVCKWCGQKLKKNQYIYCDSCQGYFDSNPDKVIKNGEIVDRELGMDVIKNKQRYRFVYCLRCRYDVEKQEGYMEAKHWGFCPYCGDELVRMNREVIEEKLDTANKKIET